MASSISLNSISRCSVVKSGSLIKAFISSMCLSS